jgi:hypothetical protein
MAEFGWAYIDCSSSSGGGGGGQAAGPTGSIQFLTGSNATNGVAQLLFLTSSNTMLLTGTLDVSGTINANFMNINVTNKNVINLSASGDTKFGDTQDDTHIFTGSVHITGGVYHSYYRVTTTVYTASASDFIIGVSSSNGVTVRLPSSSAGLTGRVLTIKDEYVFAGGRPETPANQIAVSASVGSGDLIDGNGFVAIAGDNASISLYSSGDGKWFII